MPRLFLCEKPSQAQDIAAILGATGRHDGHLSGNGVIVTWCYGHLLEMAAPEDYDPALKKWSFAALPIIPSPWVWKVRQQSAAQFKVIAKLLKEAKEVIIATDADREGESIAREILERVRYQGSLKRLWLSALDAASIKKALNNLLPGEQTKPLYAAAVARAKADWMVGMNLSRAYTLAAQAAGMEGVMSVGRVQTPTLKLVVDRDLLIEQFRPVDFFGVAIHCHAANGLFIADWIAPQVLKGGEGETDENKGRCTNKQAAEVVAQRVQGTTATVMSVETALKQEPAPLTFTLSSLQLEAEKRFGFEPGQVLGLAQALYETHKIISYPRTNSGYLPVSQHSEAPLVFQALKSDGTLAHLALLAKADPAFKSRVWNDKEITAHHGIIPTQKPLGGVRLSADETKLYGLIVCHYIAQFYPLHQYQQTEVQVQAGVDLFKASGRVTVALGWKTVINLKTEHAQDAGEKAKAADTGTGDTATLPALQNQEPVQVQLARIVTKTTKAPPRFTQGTLIIAMQNIANAVDDKILKNCLKSTSGIGTEATRTGIVKGLIQRGFMDVTTTKKTLVSSDKARALMAALPKAVKDPATTALWEQALDEVAQGQRDQSVFVVEIAAMVTQLCAGAMQNQHADAGIQAPATTQMHPCPICQKPLQRRKSKNGFFWGCSAYPDCTTALPDIKGVPGANTPKSTTEATGETCPKCNQGEMHRKLAKQGKSQGSFFLSCNRYPDCKHTAACV